MEIESNLIDKLRSLPKPTLIAISGFGGSGKTTIANRIGEILNSSVIGVDSFQTKGAFNTNFSLWKIMDFARLENEVLKPFSQGNRIINYGHFDAKNELIFETRQMKNDGLLIVEGVGLFRPELNEYFSFKIWVECPIEQAIERGKKRDREEYGNPTDERWDGVWKNNDLEYYEMFQPHKLADSIVLNS